MKPASVSFLRLTALKASAILIIVLLIQPVITHAQSRSRTRRTPVGVRKVPVGTQMKIRLEDTVDTKEARSGDRFKATVLTPARYDDSVIEGHLASVKQSGKFKGRTSIVFVFDRIRYREGGTALLRAQVVRVYGEDDAKVDEEGRVESGKQGSKTTKRTVGGAVVGAVIGGVVGGGKGAAIGAAVGAGAGAGSVYIQGSKRVKLESGTEMLIRVTR